MDIWFQKSKFYSQGRSGVRNAPHLLHLLFYYTFVLCNKEIASNHRFNSWVKIFEIFSICGQVSTGKLQDMTPLVSQKEMIVVFNCQQVPSL